MTPREVAATIAASAAKSLEQVQIAGADVATLAQAIGANAAQVLSIGVQDRERLLRDLFDAALAARKSVSVDDLDEPTAPVVIRAWAAENGLALVERHNSLEVQIPGAFRWIVVELYSRAKGRAA